MKPRLWYAWPVVLVLAIQAFTLSLAPSEPPQWWQTGRWFAYGLIDIAMAFLAWLTYRRDREMQQDKDNDRRLYSLTECTCGTVFDISFPCPVHGSERKP
jgi:hypothetical protein